MNPETVHELFAKYVNEDNIEGLAALFEPHAVIIDRDGTIIKGIKAVRDYLEMLLSFRPRLVSTVVHIIDMGEVAILVSKWTMTGSTADGCEITDGGRTYDVIRRQPDGTWRIVAQNPWSTTI